MFQEVFHKILLPGAVFHFYLTLVAPFLQPLHQLACIAENQAVGGIIFQIKIFMHGRSFQLEKNIRFAQMIQFHMQKGGEITAI